MKTILPMSILLFFLMVTHPSVRNTWVYKVVGVRLEQAVINKVNKMSLLVYLRTLSEESELDPQCLAPLQRSETLANKNSVL